ncbi:MAG TPA: hypothetical protein VEK79_18810 [Thermoanaerobaculia bacterium]|nr:hypothetical protein [Thermoanaerobaculia bacterium]
MRTLAALAACALLAGCGFFRGTQTETTPAAKTAMKAPPMVQPRVDIVQLVGPQQLNWESGQIEMKYALRVTNPGAVAITLRQIQIQTVGTAGSYVLPHSSYFFRESVAAGTERSIVFHAKALSDGDRYRIDAESPVSVRVISYFEAPTGNFRKSFIKNLAQSFSSR